MLQIAVCDDELLASLAIEKQISNVLLSKGIAHGINCFCNGQELLASTLNFDIIFLDIKMKTMSGMETAKSLRNKGCSALLIFVTSSSEYMQNAFDVEAFHYILKPVDEEKLAKILLRAIEKTLPAQEDFIIIHHHRKVIKLDLSKTLYFEITGRIIKAHTTSGVSDFYEQINLLEQKLPQDKFYRCHKSYLVNLCYVKGFEKADITLNTGEKLPLSKRRYADFTSAFLIYIKGEGGLL